MYIIVVRSHRHILTHGVFSEVYYIFFCSCQDLEQQRQELATRRKEIEERTLASSERGLGLLYESEKVRLFSL
jgi:hypothetical protein